MNTLFLRLYGNPNRPPKLSPTAETDASLFSKLTFSWIIPLIRRGLSTPLQISDVPPLVPKYQASCVGEQLHHIYRAVALSDVKTRHASNVKARKTLILDDLKRKLPETSYLVHLFARIVCRSMPSSSSKMSRTVAILTAKSMMISLIFKPIWLISAIAQTFSVGYLIRSLKNGQGENAPSASNWIYFPLVCVIGLGSVAMGISQHSMFFHSTSSGVQARGAISSQIYRKLLRLSPTAFEEMSNEGELGNLLVTDLQRVLDAFNYFHSAWVNPIELIILFGLLVMDLGVSAFIGFTVILLLVPTQIMFSRMAAKRRTLVTVAADARVQKMNEILSGIRLIKFSAWEQHFREMIHCMRGQESKQLQKTSMIRAINAALYFCFPALVSVVTFISFCVFFNNRLTPDVAFTSIAVFSITSRVLILIPIGWLSTSEVKVSFKRLDRFFDLPELPNIPSGERMDIMHQLKRSKGVSLTEAQLEEYFDLTEQKGTESKDRKDRPGRSGDAEPVHEYYDMDERVRLVNACFSFAYSNSSDKEGMDNVRKVLIDISLSAKDGDLLCLVGTVGAGKSALLSGILGEMTGTGGTVWRHGDVAYCSQQPWIINGTVRENVTLFGPNFGEENFDEDWYQQVLDSCCLLPDLAAFPASDLTEVDKITISGGQKARLALARAVYSRADIYILDDPLSAVDSAVSSRLVSRLLGPNGVLATRTCIIATHNIHVMPYASKIIVLDGGKVAHSGTFDDLKNNEEIFRRLQGLTHNFDNTDGESPVSQSTENRECITKDDLTPKQEREDPRKQESDSMATNSQTEKEHSETKDGQEVDKAAGKLVVEEDRKIGHVSKEVFKKYIIAGGGLSIALLIVLMFMVAQVIRQMSQVWIGRWTTEIPDSIGEETVEFRSRNLEFAYALIGLSLGTLLLTIIRAGLLARFAIAASQRLHNQVLDRVLHAQMSFFDTNPIGRILNRFSKDLDNMDMPLPLALQDVLQIFILAAGALVTISFVIPWLLIALVPIIFTFFMLQGVYKKSSRELKRLDGISFSPIYSNFVQSFNGISTIRAFRAHQMFSRKFDELVDTNHAAFLAFQTSGRWLGFRLDCLSAAVSFITGAIILAVAKTVNVGLAGVALSESILITGAFQWGVRQAAETENLFTSVERVVTMAEETPVEDSHHRSKSGKVKDKKHQDDNANGAKWPTEGVIAFDDVHMKYRKELPTVLKSLTFQTGPRERIGIVGRTGSGKSSLLVSLFRIVELQSGSISIDGRDTKSINLDELRTAMTIVPQDPVQFNGTVRENLDPMGVKTDAEIWDAINRVQMDTVFAKMGEESSREGLQGLDTMIHDKGGNLSVGERQLLALARAILSGVKIVVLDEASASLDNHTDAIIQKTIREELGQRTVLTIAHRLKTIMDSDRVLVIDAGRVVEFDTPMNLLDANGRFAQMVRDTGEDESKVLIALAKQSDKNKWLGDENRQ